MPSIFLTYWSATRSTLCLFFRKVSHRLLFFGSKEALSSLLSANVLPNIKNQANNNVIQYVQNIKKTNFNCRKIDILKFFLTIISTPLYFTIWRYFIKVASRRHKLKSTQKIKIQKLIA